MTLISPSGSKGSLDIGVGAHEVSTAHSNIGLDPPSSCKGRLDIRAGGPEVPKAHSNIDFDSPMRLQGESGYRSWWPRGSQSAFQHCPRQHCLALAAEAAGAQAFDAAQVVGHFAAVSERSPFGFILTRKHCAARSDGSKLPVPSQDRRH